MAYIVKLGPVTLPLPPSKITWKTKAGNKTVTLINEGEVNIIKKPKLATIDFDIILPATDIPGVKLEMSQAGYYSKIMGLLGDKRPILFLIERNMPNGVRLRVDQLDVTVESINVEENVDNGFDLKLSISLKPYVEYGAKKVTVKDNKVKKKSTKKSGGKAAKKKKNSGKGKLFIDYTTKKGDTLMLIAKQFYNHTEKSYQKKIYDTNKKAIEKAAKKHGLKSSADGKKLFAGTKISIPC